MSSAFELSVKSIVTVNIEECCKLILLIIILFKLFLNRISKARGKIKSIHNCLVDRTKDNKINLKNTQSGIDFKRDFRNQTDKQVYARKLKSI